MVGGGRGVEWSKYLTLLMYKLCAATTFVGLSDDNRHGSFSIESEMSLAQYTIINTDYLEFTTTPVQRLMMVAHHLLLVRTQLKLAMY